MQTRTDPPARLYSVGHSNHALPEFLDLLARAGITAVADVRSAPYSKRLPQFNRPELERALREAGIAYVYLGEQLGGRPRLPELYDSDGRADYEKVRATEPFQQGLDRLIRGLERYTIAMMCSEADPLDCHRGLMITPALLERGISPVHLRKDGSVETTQEMEKRLRTETGIGVGILDGMFAHEVAAAERREVLAEAYRTMARKKAYQRKGEDVGFGLQEADEEVP